MFRDEKPIIDSKDQYALDKEFGKCVDQFDAQDFNLNDNGFVRNDISQLARAQSQSEYDSIMRRLVELKSQGGLPDDISNDEAISMIKPRWAQSPNEIQQFIEWTNGNVMDKVNEAYKKALQTDSKEPVKSSESSVPAE